MLDKAAKPLECRRCGAAVWFAQYCGFRFEADVTPIDLRVEIDCFLEKRYTYGLVKLLPSFFLEWRSMRNIEKKYELVLAQHRCWSAQSARVHPIYWAKPTIDETTF